MYIFAVLITAYLILLQGFITYFGMSTITISEIILTIGFSVIYTKVVFLIPERGRKILNIFFIILCFFLTFGNAIYFGIKGEIFTISQLSLLNELAGVTDMVKAAINWTYILALIIPIAFIIVSNRYLKQNTTNISNKLAAVFLAIIVFCNVSFYVSDSLLFSTVYSPIDYAKQFGFISFYAREVTPFTKGNLDDIELSNEVDTIPETEYTGLFEDKTNVVYVTAESFDDIAIDETLTPTLYKMANDGMFFENYYTLSLNTGASEFSSLTSLTPPVDGSKIENFSGDYNSIPELFNNAGYCTTGSHLNTESYYDRIYTYPNIYHFANSYFSEQLRTDSEDKSIADEHVFELSQRYLEEQNCEKTFTYYMSFYGHASYNSEKHPEDAENFEYVNSVYPDNDEPLNHYLSFNMSLDRMMSDMIDYYTKQGVIDDTIFIIVSDHFPYALTYSDEGYELSQDFIDQSFTGEDFEKYNVPFLIYDPTSKLENNTKYISNIDILPTIADLMNFDYQYAQGHSAFDTSTEGIVKWYAVENFGWLTADEAFDGNITADTSSMIKEEQDHDKEIAAKLYSLFEI